MIKVYLRYIDEIDGKLLGSFEPNEIGTVVNLAKSVKCYFDEHATLSTFCTAQFVVDADKSYFEIVFEV